MIQNLNLGPPISGLPSLKPLERDQKYAGSESFGKSLEQMSSKEKETPRDVAKEGKLPKALEKEAKAEPKGETKPEVVKKEDSEVSAKDGKAEKGKEKAVSREDAIKNFMDSFESEFEIPPTRLVEAIANLDEETQSKAPEETADAVIAQLGLDPEDQEKAQAMYAALLIGLSQAASVVQQPMMSADGGQALGNEFRQRAQTATDQRSMMNMGVDRLNQKFWMKDAAMSDVAANPMQGVSSQSLSRMMVDEGAEDSLSEQIAPQAAAKPSADQIKGKFELPPHMRGQLEQNATPAMMAALATKLAEMKAASAGGEESEEIDSETAVVKPMGPQISGQPNLAEAPVKGAAPEGQAFAQNENSAGNEFAKNLEGQNEKVKVGEKLLDKADFKNALKSLSDLNPQAMPLKVDAMPAQGATLAAGAAIAGQVATPAENETNVRQLMNQAQYLIKKGGGEVKVQMTPEGMGPIHLKLMVQDGKVNVQMSATTEEAKKTIESSLAELKTSLAAHKLSVDHVKVDVVNNVSADTATNNQMNNQGDAQRDSARQFWNQFNENFGSRSQRDSFQEMANLKGYAKAQKDPLKPIEAETRAVSGRGQGLNLVA